MMGICKHLEQLLTDVYIGSFGGSAEDVKFSIRPTPRIEIGTVDELVKLMDAGVVSFDDAHTYSNMLLGVDIQNHTGKPAQAGQFTRTYVTPQNQTSMIQARSAAKQKEQAAKQKAKASVKK